MIIDELYRFVRFSELAKNNYIPVGLFYLEFQQLNPNKIQIENMNKWALYEFQYRLDLLVLAMEALYNKFSKQECEQLVFRLSEAGNMVESFCMDEVLASAAQETISKALADN